MDDKVPEMIVFDDADYGSLHVDDNVLQLVDPPQVDLYPSLKCDKTKDNSSVTNFEATDDTCDSLLNLEEPPKIGNTDDFDEKIEISKFAEDFVDPIMKEAIAMHKSEIEGEINDNPNEFSGDKKSDKSSSDDGFEYVKKEEVAEAEKKEECIGDSSEGDEVKKDLEDIVFQEEMRLESASEEINSGTKDEYETDEDLAQTNQVSFIPCSAQEAEMNNDNETEYILEDDITKVGYDEVAETMRNLDESIAPYHSDDENIHKETIDEPLEKQNMTLGAFVEPQFYKVDHDEVQNEYIQIETVPIKEVLEEDVVEEKQESSLSHIEGDHTINDKCKDIINWTHPLSSGVTFAILMFIELGLMMEYSVISILAYSGLLLMITSFLYKIALNFRLINAQTSTNYIIKIDKVDVEHCLNITLNYVGYLHKEVKSIAYVESYGKNLKVFAMLWVLTYVGEMFNLQSLIFIGSLLLFSMPVIYTKFEKEINQLLDVICGNFNETKNKMKCVTQRFTGAR